jgi:hypothetical protein
MGRKHLHDGTHLTKSEREVIQAGIENGSTKADIARTIGKDATTVAKEIRRHRQLKPRNTFGRRFAPFLGHFYMPFDSLTAQWTLFERRKIRSILSCSR